jgi:hypothetical protein
MMGRQAGPGRQGCGAASGPQPPAGNTLEIVTSECDLVTIIHKNYRQDPTAAPGTSYGLHVRHAPRAEREADRALGRGG